MNVKHRTLTVAQFSSGQSIVSEKSKLFPQLTLFPRVSETSETNLRIQGTPFREHLVEHGFFQYAELVILTLMKGDERVQTVEERADLLLFTHSFRHQKNELTKRRIFHSTFFDKRTCSRIVKSFQGNWCFKVRVPEAAAFVIVNRKYIVIPGNTDT